MSTATEFEANAPVWIFRPGKRKHTEVLILQTTIQKGSQWQALLIPDSTPTEKVSELLQKLYELKILENPVHSLVGSGTDQADGFWVFIPGEKPSLKLDPKQYQAYSWIPAKEAESLIQSATDRKLLLKAFKEHELK